MATPTVDDMNSVNLCICSENRTIRHINCQTVRLCQHYTCRSTLLIHSRAIHRILRITEKSIARKRLSSMSSGTHTHFHTSNLHCRTERVNVISISDMNTNYLREKERAIGLIQNCAKYRKSKISQNRMMKYEKKN